jgi:DNA-binding SARP family transcriptional activator
VGTSHGLVAPATVSGRDCTGAAAYEPFAQAEITRLEEARLASLEGRVEADLALGHHGQLVAELERLVREHPLRERLRGQLMLSLYRAAREADALEWYRTGRRAMIDELGIEPGRALQIWKPPSFVTTRGWICSSS